MRKIEEQSKNQPQLLDETICLLHLTQDTYMKFKNVLHLLFVIKNIIVSNFSEKKLREGSTLLLPADIIKILEDLNHMAYISNELIINTISKKL